MSEKSSEKFFYERTSKQNFQREILRDIFSVRKNLQRKLFRKKFLER